MKHAEDSGGGSAPSTTGTPTLGGPSPGRTAMAAPKAPSVSIASPPPRPLGGGGGMPSVTRNMPKFGSLAKAAFDLGPESLTQWMSGIYQGIRGRGAP